jgi:endonuclease YncB( thermonuclease family)
VEDFTRTIKNKSIRRFTYFSDIKSCENINKLVVEMRVRLPNGQILKIRFACIDAPELKQLLGEESRNYLRAMINEAGGKVKVKVINTDRYGRSVAELWTKSGLVQSRMTAAGMAFAYDQYSKDCPNWDAVKSSEKSAMEFKRGVWRSPNFERPWDYRKSTR